MTIASILTPTLKRPLTAQDEPSPIHRIMTNAERLNREFLRKEKKRDYKLIHAFRQQLESDRAIVRHKPSYMTV